jgi:hypothetical protein
VRRFEAYIPPDRPVHDGDDRVTQFKTPLTATPSSTATGDTPAAAATAGSSDDVPAKPTAQHMVLDGTALANLEVLRNR